MRARIASILAVALVAGALSTAPRADDIAAAAQVHLDRGIAAYGAGEFTLARRELLSAVELVPHKPNPYRWLALAEIQLGDCAHARLDVDSFLARVPADDARIPELIRARDGCVQKGVPQIVPRDDAGSAAPTAPPPPPAERPLITRWWLWTAIAVGAAAAGGAVYLATRGDGATELPAIRCDASGCR